MEEEERRKKNSAARGDREADNKQSISVIIWPLT